MSGKQIKTDPSLTEDKYVHNGARERAGASRRKKNEFVSDSYTYEELFQALDPARNSWERHLGRSLEVICNKLGKDKCVLVTGKSWKQLQRYFEGNDVPAGVIHGLSSAVGASSDYVMGGVINTYMDAELERMVIDRQLGVLRKAMKNASNDDEKALIVALEINLLKRSKMIAQIGAILIDRPRYLRTLGEYADPASASAGRIDRDALEEIWKGIDVLPYMGPARRNFDAQGPEENLPSSVPPTKPQQNKNIAKYQVDTGNNEAPPLPSLAASDLPIQPGTGNAATPALDPDLHGRVVEGVMMVYKEEGAGLPPRHLGQLAARIHGELLAAYADPMERQIGLKLALEQLRRELRSTGTGDASSKRLA